MDSFLVFFNILEQCYVLCHENDLGGFLGVISPELWTDGKPMDMIVYHDWQVQNANIKIAGKNFIEKSYSFLESYEMQFGYDFSKTKKILKQDITNEMIHNAIKYAKKMETKR